MPLDRQVADLKYSNTAVMYDIPIEQLHTYSCTVHCSYNKKLNKKFKNEVGIQVIQVIKSRETRDEWWYYSIAWWEIPYFGIGQIIAITM